MFSQRLNEFIKYLGVSIYAFEVNIGVAKNTIRKAIKGEKTIGTDIAYKIFTVYPQLNLNWLIAGSGEMIMSNSTLTGTKRQNVHLLSPPKSPPNSKSENLGGHPSDPLDTIPVSLVNVRAAAGWNGMSEINEHVVEEVFHLPAAILQKGKRYAAFPITNDSMVPTIGSQDTVVAFLLDKGEWQYINNNYVYVIITRNGAVIKRVLNKLAENGHLWARSDNYQYAPYDIPLDEIVSIWQARLKFSFNFRQEELHILERLSDLEYRMDRLENK